MKTAVSGSLLNEARYMVKLKKVMLGDTEMCKESDAFCKAHIDTGCTSIIGPNEIVTKFLKEKLGKFAELMYYSGYTI